MKPSIAINGVQTEPNRVADIVQVEPGVYHAIVDGAGYEIAIGAKDAQVGDRRVEIEFEDPRKWNPAAAAPGGHALDVIKAPMPGKVVRVLVSEGDDVAAGQGVIVVEAMKMQNELKAHRAGRVSNVAVKPHDAVVAGSTLVTID